MEIVCLTLRNLGMREKIVVLSGEIQKQEEKGEI